MTNFFKINNIPYLIINYEVKKFKRNCRLQITGGHKKKFEKLYNNII